MSADWPNTTWGELIELKYGKALRGYKNAAGKFPVYGTNGPVGWCDKPLCDFPSVIIGRKGAYRGVHYSDKPFFVIDTAYFVYPKSDINLKWAYYQLLTQNINNLDSGSAIPSTSREDVYQLPVNVPPKAIQNEIVKILDCLNNKIEINRRINQTLEEIAQAIFKCWFVDFEPVKAKIEAKAIGRDLERAAMCAISGKTDAELDQLSPDQFDLLRATAALFPDEIVDSVLGPIPKGWKAGSIGDVATAKGGYAYKSKIFTEVGHPVVKIKNIVGDGTVNLDECQCIDDEQAKVTSRFSLSDGNLLMAMTGATVGKVGLVVLSGRTAYLNQRVAKFESDEFGPGISWFLFCAFQRESIFEQVVGTAQGSAQPNISSKGIESTWVVVPDATCLKKFINNAEPLFSKWTSNQDEIKTLAALRDTLLPKFLSGEIELGSAHISS